MTKHRESMRERTLRIQAEIQQGMDSAPDAPRPSKPTTAVGAQFGAALEIQELKKRLQELEEDRGAAVLIDSEKIFPTKWANRHEAAFENEDFSLLCQQVAHTNGNVQPILVQPRVGSPGEYEVIYGHRRHRANLKGGFKTRCNILPAPLSDDELFALMDAENRGRADPSLYEQGVSYAKAIDEGLYPSQNALAKSLGVSPGWVSRAVGLARLPAEVLQAFHNPMDITSKQALLLKEMADKDLELLKSRAVSIHGEKLAADLVMKHLQGQVLSTSGSQPTTSLDNGRKLGSIKTESSGAKVLRFSPNMLTDEQAHKVMLYAKQLVEEAAKV